MGRMQSVSTQSKVIGGIIALLLFVFLLGNVGGAKDRAAAKLARQERLAEKSDRKSDRKECKRRCKYGLLQRGKKRKCMDACFNSLRAA